MSPAIRLLLSVAIAGLFGLASWRMHRLPPPELEAAHPAAAVEAKLLRRLPLHDTEAGSRLAALGVAALDQGLIAEATIAWSVGRRLSQERNPGSLDELARRISDILPPATELCRDLETAAAALRRNSGDGNWASIEPIHRAWLRAASATGLASDPGVLLLLPDRWGTAAEQAQQAMFIHLRRLGISGHHEALERTVTVLDRCGLWGTLPRSDRQLVAATLQLTTEPAQWLPVAGVLAVLLVMLGIALRLGRLGPAPVDPAAETLEHVDPVDVDTDAITLVGLSGSETAIDSDELPPLERLQQPTRPTHPSEISDLDADANDNRG